MYRLLLIEDLFDVRESVKEYFSVHGKDEYVLDISYDFFDGMNKIRTNPYDVVIVDVSLSGQVGADFCTMLREHCPYPVFIILNMDNVQEVVSAISICAASLIIKPFTDSDIYEQVSGFLNGKDAPKEKHTLECNGIMINSRTGLVTVDGKPVKLSGKATALLCVLLENKNSAVSRDYLLKRVWGDDFCGRDRVVDSQIRTLRKQLGIKGSLIRTEKGEGYMIGGKQ